MMTRMQGIFNLDCSFNFLKTSLTKVFEDSLGKNYVPILFATVRRVMFEQGKPSSHTEKVQTMVQR